jgi:hypothetical protein
LGLAYVAVYKFGTLRLGAGKQAIIHTGDGTSYTTSASTHLYWGREWYVWNNTGDKVILRRADESSIRAASRRPVAAFLA